MPSVVSKMFEYTDTPTINDVPDIDIQCNLKQLQDTSSDAELVLLIAKKEFDHFIQHYSIPSRLVPLALLK